MTDRAQNEAPRPEDPLLRRIDRLVAASRASLIWERAWPRLWLSLSVILVFLAVSWLGLWLFVPWQARVAGLAIFLGLFLASLWWAGRIRQPSLREGVHRLDRSLADAHRPAAALSDRIAVGAHDPMAQMLWHLHQQRHRQAAARLSVSLPRPQMAQRDRHAWRAAPVLMAVATFFVAGPDATDRITAAFHWSAAPLAAPPSRIDGWIDPPAYTRLPPIMLDFRKPQDQALRVPEKSVIVVRFAGQHGKIEVLAGGRIVPAPEKAAERPRTADGGQGDSAKAAPAGAVRQSGAQDVVERRYLLTGDGTLALSGRQAPQNTLKFTAIQDLPPEINFVEAPKAANSGQLSVVYRAKDDYGLAGIEAVIERLPSPAGGRALVEAPRAALALPANAAGEEDSKTSLDFSAHPWAGARVAMVLIAQDDAGQTGRSETRELVLPQRPFSKPLAKALVEERRRLAMDIGARARVQMAMDAILIEPDRFTAAKGIYLGLRMVAERLRHARSDAELLDVADLMWAMALQIEDDGLSEAEKNLRAAQERLQQAIENNASQEEIKRLTDEMRRAMDRFMREFAQRSLEQQRNGNRDISALPENFRTITPRDLQNLLNRIEELTKNGDLAEAQRLLDELRNILDNLQLARPGQGDQNQREMNQALGELDALSRDQQALRDETFQKDRRGRNQTRPQDRRGGQQAQPRQNQRGQQGQRGQQQGQQGQRGEQGDSGQGDDEQDGEGAQGQQGQGQQGSGQGGSLSERQQQLRDRLGQLQRRMRGMGAQGSEGLGEADQAMREAENALGRGGGEGEATDAQGRAVDALRRGAQEMARQMQPGDQDGDGTEQAEGGPGGNPNGQPRGRADQRTNDDPLGRPQRSRDWSDGRVKVPGEGESATVRARRILEELRRRLGESSRPQEEIDYFERLLRRN